MPPRLSEVLMRCGTADRSEQRSNRIRVTPPLRIVSVSVAWPVPAAVWQLASILFCVANMLGAACAYLVPDAAVPWNLYALKIAQTQLAMKPILFFSTK